MRKQFNLGDLMEDGKVPSYAWPGGYPLFYFAKDCGVLCPDCVNGNLELVKDPDDPQWYVVGADVNWEDTSMYCDNCNKTIESAYGEDAEVTQ